METALEGENYSKKVHKKAERIKITIA